jgi:adenylyl- and sulfurtransferase ThiI
MTQSTESSEPSAVSVPVVLLREALKSADDKAIEGFLHGYVLGTVADQFIRSMTVEGQRAEFFVAIAKTYVDDWNAAIKQLSEG